jgi:hypothetical protein
MGRPGWLRSPGLVRTTVYPRDHTRRATSPCPARQPTSLQWIGQDPGMGLEVEYPTVTLGKEGVPMRRIRRHVAAMAWVMVALMLASCSSYQQLPLDSHPDPEDISFVVRGLNMGDHVRIRTRSNETLRGRVIGWNEKEIEITNDRGPQTIPLRHVCSVERITPSRSGSRRELGAGLLPRCHGQRRGSPLYLNGGDSIEVNSRGVGRRRPPAHKIVCIDPGSNVTLAGLAPPLPCELTRSPPPGGSPCPIPA